VRRSPQPAICGRSNSVCWTLAASIRPCIVLACLFGCASPTPLGAQGASGPVIVVETSKGTFAFETFPDDAPRTVKHVIDLVRKGFYDGQRIHRAVPAFVIQWGDPQSRDESKEAVWGKGAAASSGMPVGAAEIPKKRTHMKGAVGIAHPGNPAQADSQIYVMLERRDDLNGRYGIFGRVIAGVDVPDRMRKGDLIQRMYIKE
jgi:peptidyl-prolyl cis-trans isomerase A (cyclophilin A)